MSKTQGKEFEGEIGQSLKALSKTMALSYRNSNLPLPMCDHLVWHDGRGYLLEEKEVHSDSISFRCITDKERENMEAITKANCEGWILVKHIAGNVSRCFACLWVDWLALESGFGFDPASKRNKPGSGSFYLVPDDQRPAVFIELVRVDRKDCDGNHLGRNWDISCLFTGDIPL